MRPDVAIVDNPELKMNGLDIPWLAVASARHGLPAREERVKSILLEEANKHELVLKDPAPFARLSKQNASSLDFTMRVWVESDNYWTVNFDLMERITKRFTEEGIEIPFNQIDVTIKK